MEQRLRSVSWLAPEIDGKSATAMGVLQDDLTRRRPGLTLLADLLEETGSAWALRQTLARPGSLSANGLISPDSERRGALAVAGQCVDLQ